MYTATIGLSATCEPSLSLCKWQHSLTMQWHRSPGHVPGTWGNRDTWWLLLEPPTARPPPARPQQNQQLKGSLAPWKLAHTLTYLSLTPLMLQQNQLRALLLRLELPRSFVYIQNIAQQTLTFFFQHRIKTLIQHIITSATLFPYQVLPDLTGLIVQDSILEQNWNNSSDKVGHFPHTTSSCTITRGKAKYWLLWHILFTLLSEYTTLSSTSCWRWPPPCLGFKKVSLDSHRNQIQTMHFTEQYLNQGFPECNIILIALFSWAQKTQTRLIGEAPTCSCIITKSLLRK